MEADAVHSFSSTAPDELPFSKNSLLKIINVEDDPNWYLAEQNGRTGLVPCNYISIRPNPWYIAGCNRFTAEERLLEVESNSGQYIQPDGAFILRPSAAGGRGLSISVKDSSRVLHFKVFQDEQGKYFVWMSKFDSINQLIDYHRRTSISRERLLTLVDFHPSKTLPSSNKEHLMQRVIARFDFDATEAEELSFRRGDVIEVLGHDDENWWRGRISNSGKTGLFPANYVDSLPSIPIR